MDYNRTDKTELDEYTSGYSTAKTSPQTSNEDLLRLRVRSRQYSSSDTEESDNYSDEEGITEEEEDLVEHCEFRPVVRSNELDPYKEWYHKLLTMRTNYKNGENAFPPFPPPPLPSTMLAASRAQAINLFEEVKRAAVKATVSPNHSAVDIAAHRFCPHDFQILPPPHVFLGMIKTLAPHQYIDLTYALAGAVLLELGAKVPTHFPPLPPKIDPFRDIKEEEHHETEVSSQSSSGGEYSDASEETLFVERTKREKNCQRRAARKMKITAKMLLSNREENESDDVEQKSETFLRDHTYKSITLTTFIPSTKPRHHHHHHHHHHQMQPPLIHPFIVPFPIIPPPPQFFLHPLAPAPPILFSTVAPISAPIIVRAKTTTSVKKKFSPVVETRKIMLSKNESALANSFMRWRNKLKQ